VSKFLPGDFVKVEFEDEKTGESEWMWVRVRACDDENRIVLGRLDSDPILGYRGKLKPGSELAVRFDKIRDHKRGTDF
jgi:hypothetical protein